MLKKSPSALATFALMMAIGVSPKFLTNFPILRIKPVNAQSVPSLKPVPEGTVVKMDGTTAAETVNQVFQQRFQAENPGAKVELNYQGTEEALKAIQAGKVDLVTIGRPLTDEEKAAGLVEEPLGRYKIAVIVSEKNPFASSLTDQQFAKIFRGEITNWSEVGGPNKPISFIDRPAFSDTRQAFSTYPVFQENFATGSTAVPVTTDETKAVIENLGDGGIGYAIADQVINLTGIRVLPLHKVLPTDKRYSFSAPLYYVYKKDSPSPASKSFLGYVNTPPNQQVITELRENIVIPAPLPASNISSVNTTSPSATGTNNTTSSSATGTNNTASPGTTGATGTNNTASPGTTGANTASPNATATVSPGANATVDPNNPNATATVSPGVNATASPNATATASPGVNATVNPNNPNATATVSPGVNATASPNATATVSPGVNATISPGAGGTVDPNTNTGTTLQQGSTTTTTTTTNQTNQTGNSGLPWWLWLLGIPILGGLLWFLLNGEEEDAMLAAGVADKKANRIILTPRDCKNAYAYWEVSPEKLKQTRHNDNDQLALRIHDVTNIDIDRQEPHSIKQYDCTEVGQQDMHVPISQDNRDYLAELGYVDNDGKWYPIVSSAPVRVPACNPDVTTTKETVTTAPVTMTPPTDTVTTSSVTTTAPQTETITPPVTTTEESAKTGLNLAGIAGAAAATVAGVATAGNLTNRADATPVHSSRPSRLVLVPRSADDLYAYWELNTTEQNQAKAAGGEKLTLRLSEVTGLDPATDQVNSVKEYECSELEQDQHITIPNDSRQYKADLGYLTKTGDWLPLASSSIVDSQIISQKANAIKESSAKESSVVITPNITTPNIPNINVTSTTTTISETTDPVSKPESFADKLKGKVGDLIGKGENITEKVSETVKGKFSDLVVEGGELKEKIQDRLQQPESSESLGDRIKDKVTDVATSSKNVVTGLGAGLAAVTGGVIASTIGQTGKSETTTTAKKVGESRVILVPRYFRDAYAYWELQENQMNQAKQNGGQQLVLRICNVTEDPINQSEEKIIEFPCSESSQDLHLTVTDSADYLAEIGYKTSDGMWISLAKSEVVHIPVSSAR